MKSLRTAGRWLAVFGLLLAGLLLVGCQSEEPVYTDFAGTTVAPRTNDVFQIGDVVSVTCTGTSATEPPLKDQDQTIKEDGTITLQYIGEIKAAGRTPGSLQKEIQEKYDHLYNHITVIVQFKERFFYVFGEVNKQGPEPYLPGQTDIIKAISSAGGFTEFANKKKVRLTRANGRIEIINVLKAINGDSKNDVSVYPGDKIVVRRRLF